MVPLSYVVIQEDDEKPGGACTDSGCPERGSEHSSGLPQAGTLVVAPTSLLKQWQSEIKNKVCSRTHKC